MLCDTISKKDKKKEKCKENGKKICCAYTNQKISSIKLKCVDAKHGKRIRNNNKVNYILFFTQGFILYNKQTYIREKPFVCFSNISSGKFRHSRCFVHISLWCFSISEIKWITNL